MAREIRELVIGHRLKGIEADYDLWTYEDEKRDAVERWATLIERTVSPQTAAPSNVVDMPARTA